MEKYSAYRDPGTGIQPFLTPVPPNAPTILANVILPFGIIIGIVRITLVLLVAILYFSVEVVLRLFSPVMSAHNFLSRFFTALLARSALALLGLWWIPVTYVTRKRGRGVPAQMTWSPQAGDLIISNWASWIEILWLAYRFNPVFVVPVMTAAAKQVGASKITASTGRRTGTGSAAVSSPVSRSSTPRVPVIGFRIVPLLSMLRLTGHAPPFSGYSEHSSSLEDIRTKASRPVVVFPECTTSNGRALLRFSEVFGEATLPVKNFAVFVMCARYDPPTLYNPTLTCSIPSSPAFNPLPHMFQVASSLSPSLSQSLSIRLLNPAESPSSPHFEVNDVLIGGGYKDQLAEACSTLIAQLGKMRITGQAWEDKVAFLEFYRGKKGK